MKSLFEEMGGTYRWEGDYLLPDLELPTQDETVFLGKYRRMRLHYLKEHHCYFPIRSGLDARLTYAPTHECVKSVR